MEPYSAGSKCRNFLAIENWTMPFRRIDLKAMFPNPRRELMEVLNINQSYADGGFSRLKGGSACAPFLKEHMVVQY